MKNRNPALISILGMSLLAASAAWAQNQTQTQPALSASSAPPPMPATQNTQNAASAPPAAAQTPGTSNPGAGSATFSTAQGQVVINSTMPPAPSAASPPSFEQLANGKKYISKDDANAYPPLANDFLYASHNGSRISKAQYERWVKTLN